MKHAVAIRHVAFEGLGSFEAVLADRGFTITVLDAGVDDLAPAETADLLLVLGGPIGVYDEPLYPFLTDEIALVGRRIASGRPLVGICLGAQLIARAAGSAVYPGPAKEIGYAPIRLTPAGEQSPLALLHAADDVVLHWHGDTFDLPAGAELLASTALTPNQAFSLGANVLALQFHMEAGARCLERWLIGHTGELRQANIDIPALRAEGARIGRRVAEAGARAFAAWLDDVIDNAARV